MRWLPALALWTLFVWGGRVRLADGAPGSTVLALAFVILAAWLLAAWWTRRDAVVPLAVVGVVTIGVWVARLVDIALFSDHSAGFVVVHAVLAIVSIVLVSVAWANRDRARRPAPA